MDRNTDRPIILAVDDELASLDVLAHELRKRYGVDYEVVPEQHSQAALETLRRWKEEGRHVALVLADQWMPGLHGADLLGQTRALHPLAKRVMLVPWGEPSSPETLLHGCAVGQIEYFIPKPWPSRPDEEFHAMVSDFLREWTRLNRPAFEAVKIIGESRSRRCFELLDLLHRNGIPAGFYPVDAEEAQALLREFGLDASRLPVAIVFGGHVLVDPSDRELSLAMGTRSAPLRNRYDLAIVGAGPAGLAAAVYGSSEGLDIVVIEREALGGQAAHSTMIRNYLGFPKGISGDELSVRAYQQAWQFGAAFLLSNAVLAIEGRAPQYRLRLDDGSELTAAAVIVASGMSYRRLGIAALERFVGAGVFYVSVSNEAFGLTGERVFVIGAGNSAGQAALHLAKYAEKVTILTRHGRLEKTMSTYLVTEIDSTPNIDVMVRSELVDGDGDQRLRQVTITDLETGERKVHEAGALFVLIGARPHTGWLPDAILRDQEGYVLTGQDVEDLICFASPTSSVAPFAMETSLPGVFAAGDVRHGSTKRVASAVGEGAAAIASVERWLAQRAKTAA